MVAAEDAVVTATVRAETFMINLEKSQERNVVQFALHALIWSFLFSFPLLFSEEEPAWRRILQRHWLPLFLRPRFLRQLLAAGRALLAH